MSIGFTQKSNPGHLVSEWLCIATMSTHYIIMGTLRYVDINDRLHAYISLQKLILHFGCWSHDLAVTCQVESMCGGCASSTLQRKVQVCTKLGLLWCNLSKP